MRTNKEQTEYILKKRDEYNRNIAKKRKSLFYAIPLVAVISLIVVFGVITVSLNTKSQSAEPINHSIENADKSNSYYSNEDEHVSGEVISPSSGISEKGNDSNIEDGVTSSNTGYLQETTSASDLVSQRVESTTVAKTENPSAFQTIETTTPQETNVVDESKSTTIETTQQATTNSPTVIPPIVEKNALLSSNGSDYFNVSETFNSISIANEKTQALVESEDGKEYYVYEIKGMPSNYMIFGTDKEQNYLFYSYNGVVDYAQLEKDFSIKERIDVFSKLSGNIEKKDLLTILPTIKPVYPNTTPAYSYTKTITLISGAKSGFTTLYLLRFSFDDLGHGRLDIYSYSTNYLIASAFFAYDTNIQ